MLFVSFRNSKTQDKSVYGGSKFPPLLFSHHRAKLLSFAVTYCSNDMIQPILQARALLETQVGPVSIAEEVSSIMLNS